MIMYAIKHKPTGKYFYEDEGGTFLVDKEILFEIDDEECCAVWEIKEDADDILDDMKSYPDGLVWIEDMEFPVSEFEVSNI